MEEKKKSLLCKPYLLIIPDTSRDPSASRFSARRDLAAYVGAPAIFLLRGTQKPGDRGGIKGESVTCERALTARCLLVCDGCGCDV